MTKITKYQIVDTAVNKVLFTVDCEQAETAETRIKWTDKPIEDGAEMARFGVLQPNRYTIDGIVTASPLGREMDPQIVIDAHEALDSLAKKRQEVTALMGYFSKRVVIESVSASARAGDGGMIGLTIALKEIRQVTPDVIDMPKARMKKKVQKRAAKTKKGGAQSGKAPNGKQQNAVRYGNRQVGDALRPELG